MPRAKTDTTQLAVRIPNDWLERLDGLLPWLAKPGVLSTRTDAIRAAIAKGLDALEAQKRAEDQRFIEQDRVREEIALQVQKSKAEEVRVHHDKAVSQRKAFDGRYSLEERFSRAFAQERRVLESLRVFHLDRKFAPAHDRVVRELEELSGIYAVG